MKNRHGSELKYGDSLEIYHTSGRAHEYAFTRTFFSKHKVCEQKNQEKPSTQDQYGTLGYTREAEDILQEAINQSQLDLQQSLQEDLAHMTTINGDELHTLLGQHQEPLAGADLS